MNGTKEPYRGLILACRYRRLRRVGFGHRASSRDSVRTKSGGLEPTLRTFVVDKDSRAIDAALGHVKQLIKLQQGVPVEKAKELIRVLKDSKIKVQGSIQGDQLRVSGKNRDDLQSAIALLREQQEPQKLDLQFTNFRD